MLKIMNHTLMAVALLATVFPATLRAQMTFTRPPASGAAATSKDKPVAVSNEEKLKWCREVKSVAGGAAGLEPAMRAFVLTTAAGGLKQCDPAKVQQTLTDAFRATLAITAENQETQQQLQVKALTALSHESESATEQLVASALPEAQGEVMSQLIERAASAGKFDRALELLHRIPPQGFPWRAASRLMDSLPAGRESDRLSIFRAALLADEAPAEGNHQTFGSDFSDLIRRQWRRVPRDLALEAVHEVLDKAKAADENSKNPVSLQFMANGKNASFDKLYDFKLIQLLGVLQSLDPQEAERRLNESDSLKKVAADFPNGLPGVGGGPPPGAAPPDKDVASAGAGSAAAAGTPHPGPKPAGGAPGTTATREQHMQMSFSAGGDGTSADQLAAIAAMQGRQQRMEEIARQVDDNPKQAIQAALALPEAEGDSHPREEALARIARDAKAKHPSAARDALEEMAKLGKNDQPPSQPGAVMRFPWADATTLAAELKEAELAKKLLSIGLDYADKLKTKDTGGDDPNTALKAWWPSTNAAIQMVAAAGKISPQDALSTARQFQDQDWQLLCRLRLANDALGASKGETRTVVSNKSGSNWTSVSNEE